MSTTQDQEQVTARTVLPTREHLPGDRLRVDGHALLIVDRPDLRVVPADVVFKLIAPPHGAGLHGLHEEGDGRCYGIMSRAELAEIATPAAALSDPDDPDSMLLPVSGDRVVLRNGHEADVLGKFADRQWQVITEDGRYRVYGLDEIVGHVEDEPDGEPADISEDDDA